MKKIRYSIILLAMLLAVNAGFAQQRDSRNRLASTVIADGLTQLPAQTSQKYNQVIGEMAATGAEGIEMLAGMLYPSDQGKNATFQYAIDGIVSYVSSADKAELRQSVHDGIVNSLKQTSDKGNKAFLIAQLQKISTAADAALLKGYLADPDMSDYAAAALAQTPGIDNVVTEMIVNGTGEKDKLAYLAAFKKLASPEVEQALLGWTSGADTKTLRSVYNALATCGTSKSLPVLAAAAKAAGYVDDATAANNSYLQLLNNLAATDTKAVATAAKGLTKAGTSAVRCAGLELLLQTAGNKAPKEILKALKDGDIQYRNTALQLAEQVAGKDIFSTITQKFSSLPTAAKIDVVRWLGNNKAAAFTNTVVGALSSKNNTLAEAAISSLGQIGGEKALAALIGQLSGSHSAQAAQSLLAFNGSINNGVAEALKSTDVNTQVEALKLASARRMSSAYPQVVKLLSADNNAVKTAAYEALKGVGRAENFNEICALMEKNDASKSAVLQEAAKNAIQSLTADEQFNIINKQLSTTNKASLYFPLLAQAGNQGAIAKLVEQYKNPATEAEAYKSLLKVNNPEMIDVLYNIAESKPNLKDNTLERYLELVGAAPLNGIRKYQLLSKALALNPSDGVASKFVSALGNNYNLPSLNLAAKYLDNKTCALAAATAVKTILAKKADLMGGSDATAYLKKARDIFRAQSDADSGYAVDEITGMLPRVSADGYQLMLAEAKVDPQEKRIALPEKYENFELYFEWQSSGKADVNLRGMSILSLDAAKGTSLYANEYASEPLSGWNSLSVKVLNDRIQLVENGVEVLSNAVIKNNIDGRTINSEGVISWWSTEGQTQLRNVYLKQLPSTPVYELSAEEKKAGFEVLFDGRSLEKWHGNTINYVPQDGTIYVSAGYGNNGNLYTNKKYSDFVYRFEFCFLEPGVNNGIGIRTKDNVDAAYDGMEIQVLDHDDPIYKGLRPYQQHGAVYGIIVPKHVTFQGTGVWNTEEIRAVGDHITVTVNGEVILDGNIREACQGHNVAPDGSNVNPYTVDHLNHPGLFNKEGYISFCGHGEGVKFRNVRILDLGKSKKGKR